MSAHHALSSIVLAAALLATPAPATHAQASSLAPPPASPAVSQPLAGSNWQRVEALPVKTNVHITTDHGSKTCHIFAVTDDTLTCAKGSNEAGAVVPRAEIKHIKLTHYGRSTLVGTGIGGGVGAIAGAIGGRNKPCTGICLNILGPGAVAAVVGVGGAVVGSIVGGTTDMARGSSIYVRP